LLSHYLWVYFSTLTVYSIIFMQRQVHRASARFAAKR